MRRALAAACLVVCACAGSPEPPAVGQSAQAVKHNDRGYRFTRVVTLGDPDPGGLPGSKMASADDGGYMIPMGINNEGEVVFDALVDTTWVEAMFAWNKGVSRPIMRGGDLAPGADTFSGYGAVGTAPPDDDGNVLIPWFLDPVGLPYGVGAGVWFYDAEENEISAVMVPGVTKVPGAKTTFVGVDWDGALNNRGDKVFSGVTQLPGLHGEPPGVGVFLSDRHGKLSGVVVPGDKAPGDHKRFDQAWHGWPNDQGDIAFGAHVEGEECIHNDLTFSLSLNCFESVYLKNRKGKVISIAHQGEPAPGGGTYRIAWGPNLNNDGDILFVGDLSTPPDTFVTSGMYLYHDGAVHPIASPGDVMPGGGTMVAAAASIYGYHLTNRGEAVFRADLDDGAGLYSYRDGETRLIARTGSQLPGIGTLVEFGFYTDAHANDDGDLIFQAVLDNGDTTLLLARR